MRNKFFFFVFILIAALPVWAAGDTLVIAQGVDATTLDPVNHQETPTANVAAQIFDNFYRRLPNGHYEPWLGEAKALDDLTWELTVKKGIRFHNGEELNADVIKFNFDRLLNPDKPLKYSTYFKSITSVEVTGPYTLKVTTSKPSPLFLTRLTYFWVVPKKYIEEKGDAYFANHPVGTGPYKFVRWVKDQEIDLEANEDYWAGKPKIKKVVYRPIPEASSRVAELVTGGVDIITNLSPEAVDAVNSSGVAEARSVPSIRNIFIELDVKGEGPLHDPKVRQALNYAVDKEAIIKHVLGGNGVPVGCPLNPYMFGYDEKLCEPFPYDPIKAKQLLAEAGYPNGFTFTMGSPSGRYLNDRQVAEAVVGQLAQVGVKADLKVQEWSSYVGQILERKIPTDAWLIGWGNAQFDADNTLFTLLYGGTVEGGPNKTVFDYWQDPEFDKYIIEAQTVVDQAKRKELYRKALERVRAGAPWIFLYQQKDIYGVNKRVKWQPRPDELIWAFDAEIIK